jgi:large subunit ribosomal protein L18
MADRIKVKHRKRMRKAAGVRRTLRGDATRPRLTVFRSSKFVYAQAIDDRSGRTLAAASELEKDLATECKSLSKGEAAKLIGKTLAQRLLEKGIDKVVLDRGWYRYHGRLKALADAAREGGLKF